MDSEDEGEVFAVDRTTLTSEEEDGDVEEENEEEEEDAKIFNAWMQRYRGGEQRKTTDEERQEGSAESTIGAEPSARLQTERRSSLPCPATPTTAQLARLHSCTRAPVTAKTLLRRSSSRRLLPSQQEGAACAPAAERRSSLIPTIPEANMPERKSQFRRRNVMSLSDADSMCLICHHDLNRAAGGIRELQCTHTFHRECIEEWLWRKQSCPTCHVQVFTPQQAAYWSSTRVIVP
ncbi:uncharacterized protein si:ch211-207l14.1 isoform X2 [Hippocampus zosterae]|uniref:uncharacterized protein si:ch211-207l14.1 isoform X2 n=1 Tax=Hippocampus zosterae TaxID=109293 RepID=UPI00223DD6CF|nr:uncharacterized protein si:ch211-207l14.1 isoform X2 [Hippocampus zosterae]